MCKCRRCDGVVFLMLIIYIQPGWGQTVIYLDYTSSSTVSAPSPPGYITNPNRSLVVRTVQPASVKPHRPPRCASEVLPAVVLSPAVAAAFDGVTQAQHAAAAAVPGPGRLGPPSRDETDLAPTPLQAPRC